jgi:alcohol dehydrogenase class IV
LCDVYYGPSVISKAGELAKATGAKKALVVTDSTVDSTGHPDRVIKYLEDAGISCKKFADIEMDAPDYVVNKGAKNAYDFAADIVVAVGGGSCLDAAKAITLVAANLPDCRIQDFFDKTPDSIIVKNPPLKNIMIPTTSGTGSESTFVAVVTDTAKHRKCGCFISPQIAIVDPELTLGLSAEITAYTAMDAFSHSTEAIASKGMNPHSDLLALNAIERIIKWAPVAISEPDNLIARENLALASNFAGKAFNDATVNIGHAMAHSLGACYHVPHGIACALVTPAVIEKTAFSRPDEFRKIASYFGIDSSRVSDIEIGKVVADAVRQFCHRIRIPTLKQLGFTLEQIISCTEYVKTEGMRFACLANIPDDDIVGMFERTYNEYQ